SSSSLAVCIGRVPLDEATQGQSVMPCTHFLGVCRSSILAKTRGSAVSLSRPRRGTRRVCERHTATRMDQRYRSTHAATWRNWWTMTLLQHRVCMTCMPGDHFLHVSRTCPLGGSSMAGVHGVPHTPQGVCAHTSPERRAPAVRHCRS